MAGESATCLNGGACNNMTGVCQCAFGYNGTTCFKFLGCNAGGVYSCLNGGNCNFDGTCQCLNGFTGTVCQNRK